jgi:TolB protein
VRVAAISEKEQHRSKANRQVTEIRIDLWVVDVTSGYQRRLAQFAPTSLFLHQFLPFADQYALSHRIWSPGGDAIVIPVLEDDRPQIAVVPLGRGSVQLIAEGQMAFWSHQ